ncbi:MAG: hypothetical protein AAGG50_10965 [Bacteroidota bacterium]
MKRYRYWLAVYAFIAAAYGLMTTDVVAEAVGLAVGLLLLSGLLTAMPWALSRLVGKPMDAAQVFSTYSVAFFLILFFNWIGYTSEFA